MALRLSWGSAIPFIFAICWALVLGCQQTEKLQQADAQNTGMNARDRGGEQVTPIDQSNNEADLKITQTIRQAIVGDQSLPLLAKNVKIITIAGTVTLRGPVENETEKVRIGAIAEQTPGVIRVDNQLEIASGKATRSGY